MLLATTKRLRQQFATEGSESDWSLSAWSVFSPHVSTANRENCPREKKKRSDWFSFGRLEKRTQTTQTGDQSLSLPSVANCCRSRFVVAKNISSILKHYLIQTEATTKRLRDARAGGSKL